MPHRCTQVYIYDTTIIDKVDYKEIKTIYKCRSCPNTFITLTRVATDG